MTSNSSLGAACQSLLLVKSAKEGPCLVYIKLPVMLSLVMNL